MKNILIILSLTATVVACSSMKYAAYNNVVFDNSDIERMQAKFPSISIENLKEGKSLFENNCNLCHDLNYGYKQNEQTLNKYVPGMSKKVNKKRQAETITDEGKQLILQYLVTLNEKADK